MSTKRLLFCLLALALFTGSLYASPGNTESLEPVTTKEFVRQELAPINESVDKLWQVMLWGFGALLAVMLGGFALLLTIMIYLHRDTKGNIGAMEGRLKEDTKDLKADLKADIRALQDTVLKYIAKDN